MKNLKKISILMFLLLILIGCATESGRKPFAPPPEAYEMWIKPGTDFIQVQAALLECGLPAPFSVHKFFKDISHQELLELNVKVELCMKKNGFDLLPGLSSMCKSIPALQACQPENYFSIPSRSIERRLNSEFCNDPFYKKNKACVVVPSTRGQQ